MFTDLKINISKNQSSHVFKIEGKLFWEIKRNNEKVIITTIITYIIIWTDSKQLSMGK